MTAQFIPPAKPILGDDERKAVDEVIASGMVAQGPQVHAFEDEFSSQVVDGVHCVAVNSGTSALEGRGSRAVSYTHLTLPTIYSV